MRLIIILFFTIITVSLQAQAVELGPTNFQLKNDSELEMRGGGGAVTHTVIIYPNPVPFSEQRLHFWQVNVSVFSFVVTKSTGEIVEIDNLIGRDPIDVVTLPDVPPGLYFISFNTNYGIITKSFTVI
ncbi:MAG: T9SS type A sorting domain-containing protein [Chitinophagales bacterium]|nr:T9SS type A sorting domain-containing protein [Chitinophagales bacterium]